MGDSVRDAVNAAIESVQERQGRRSVEDEPGFYKLIRRELIEDFGAKEIAIRRCGGAIKLCLFQLYREMKGEPAYKARAQEWLLQNGEDWTDEELRPYLGEVKSFAAKRNRGRRTADALTLAIGEILAANPNASDNDVLSALLERSQFSAAGSDIEWMHRGARKSAPVSGLKDRISRIRNR